ncbi:hypothetical protein CLV62_10246 [Dysgonomonas alginatilytica]|uniref:Uncharacterized protein n=1 Tax=Dysgonomonas alginatilytica TaxID=1605892 RepID=A0A2V3PUF0_9BACT|nr:hypothetical protein [Dysgonomonas alginatilytica]PXV68016.1 hypothetical protein CLV62_10246 [Dysgonomonas alginatilytica]
MNLSKLILLFGIFFSLFFLACSEPSIQDDAHKAAELSMLSNTAAMENDLSTAGNLYNDVQAIMNKYRQNGKFEEFYQLYSSFLAESAVIEDQKTQTTSSGSDSAPE